MTIPAIRAKIGIWVYYLASLKFSDVIKIVNDPTQIHKSKMLNELLQRGITENVKSIADYIANQEERFFNSLVLAVYDGDPNWREVCLDYGDGEEYYDIGLLVLSGKEKIFPVDGQHRVEGIKRALAKDETSFCDEQIPVIFIGHKKNMDGMERARRMFSTLNRYAKPVSKRDIIALDEDDAAAIVSRELINTHPLFNDKRLLDYKTKAIQDSNETAFTTIITLYECNIELLNLFLLGKHVRDADKKLMRDGPAKANRYMRIRPPQVELDVYTNLSVLFWDALSKNIDVLIEYLLSEPKRVSSCLLFRPAALIPFVKAFIHIHKRSKSDFFDIAKKFNKLSLNITDSVWQGLLWDSDNKVMLTKNHKAVQLRLVHLYDSELLTTQEKIELTKEYAKARVMSVEEAKGKLGES